MPSWSPGALTVGDLLEGALEVGIGLLARGLRVPLLDRRHDGIRSCHLVEPQRRGDDQLA
jgi:hypothetical protein